MKNWANLQKLLTQPSAERKLRLEPLLKFLLDKITKKEEINLNFICTHNSRRSQFAQFWSAYFSELYQLGINSYSGGTEVTACHPNTINALERLHFKYEKTEEQDNPHYLFKPGNSNIELFSKLHSNAVKGKNGFAALMCCSDAAENCPFVPGTQITIPLNYTDPKWADGSSKEKKAYDECCLQIASEINYVFSQLKRA